MKSKVAPSLLVPKSAAPLPGGAARGVGRGAPEPPDCYWRESITGLLYEDFLSNETLGFDRRFPLTWDLPGVTVQP